MTRAIHHLRGLVAQNLLYWAWRAWPGEPEKERLGDCIVEILTTSGSRIEREIREVREKFR